MSSISFKLVLNDPLIGKFCPSSLIGEGNTINYIDILLKLASHTAYHALIPISKMVPSRGNIAIS
jgi:hypothetical protein